MYISIFLFCLIFITANKIKNNGKVSCENYLVTINSLHNNDL